jgi:hypothetical protein
MTCTDLASGVDVPPDHYDYPPNREGVWWDCTAIVPTLKDALGDLATVLGDGPR